MAYQYFRLREFLKLFAGVVLAILFAAFLNFQFGLPLTVLPIAGLVILVGIVFWLGFIGKSGRRGRDLLKDAEANRTQERELIRLLKAQADSDTKYRGHALRTIREIEARSETGNAELERIAAMGQRHLPQAALLRSKRILALVVLGWLSLFAIAYVRDTPKIGVLMLGMGMLALWFAQHLFFTRQPIYRKGGPQLEFEKEPVTYTSAVLASCAIGLFFVYVGVYAAP